MSETASARYLNVETGASQTFDPAQVYLARANDSVTAAPKTYLRGKSDLVFHPVGRRLYDPLTGVLFKVNAKTKFVKYRYHAATQSRAKSRLRKLIKRKKEARKVVGPKRGNVSHYLIEKDLEHLQYLKRVSTGDSALISRATAHQAAIAWKLIRKTLGPIAVPAACTGPDGQMFYAWDLGRHHLELEFIPGSAAEFFYRDRESEALWDAEYRVGDPLPKEAIRRLRYFVAT